MLSSTATMLPRYRWIVGSILRAVKPGGRLVIPVGPTTFTQELLVIRKDADGRTVTQRTLPVRFVPLTRER